MDLNRRTMKKLMALIAFGIAFCLGLLNLYRFRALVGTIAAILQPILLGFVVAYIFNILMREIETRAFARMDRRFVKHWPRIRRPLSISISLMLVFGLFALIAFIIVPDLITSVTNIANDIPSLFHNLQKQYETFVRKNPIIGAHMASLQVDWDSVTRSFAQEAKHSSTALVNFTISFTTSLLNGFVSFILGFIIAVNILFSKEKLKEQFRRLLYAFLPKDYPEKTIRLLRITDRAFSDFITGQCLGAAVLGGLCFLGMLVFRFPFSLLISVLVAFFALLPILGQIFSVLIGALLILTVSPIQALWFTIYLLVLQQINGNLIYPKVVGSKIGLPTLWVLVAIALGGNLFGIVGMLVSIPIFSVARTLLKESIDRRLAKRKPAAEEK